MRLLSRHDLMGMLDDEAIGPAERSMMGQWLERGDGIAVYRNEEMGSPTQGHLQFVSFGSPESQIEDEEPPERLPDIGSHINWRYQLYGTFREKAVIDL